MTAPFIFVGTHRVKPGKCEDFMKYFTEFCTGVVEPNEPRLHSFFGYTAPNSDLVTVVQVHPDAESMQHHLQMLGEKVRATSEFTDFESLEIYGELNDALREWLPYVTEGIQFTHHAIHWGGFSRLQSATDT